MSRWDAPQLRAPADAAHCDPLEYVVWNVVSSAEGNVLKRFGVPVSTTGCCTSQAWIARVCAAVPTASLEDVLRQCWASPDPAAQAAHVCVAMAAHGVDTGRGPWQYRRVFGQDDAAYHARILNNLTAACP